MNIFGKKLIQLIGVSFAVGTLVFLLVHLIPGDPIDALLGESALPVARAEMRHNLGLDLPLTTQYFQFWKNLLHGSMGNSLISNRPVVELIKERMGASISLALLACLLAWGVSIPMGIFAATKASPFFKKVIFSITLLGISIPNFWLGPILAYVFAIHWPIFPVSERNGILSYFLPAFCLALGMCSLLIRLTHNNISEILKNDYITTARSKGLSENNIFYTHALKNSLIPLISIMALQLGGLLSGAIIVETIFDWPGIGELLMQSIGSRDYPTAQACVLVISLIYVLVNTLADIAYSWANPQMRVL